MKNKLILLMLLAMPLAGQAKIKLQPLFSSNMVLQQQTQAPIWGEASPNKKVTVTTSWNQKRYQTKADAQGRWRLSVETPAAGGPYDITISDGKAVKLSNVLIGEVWICSGQSNMEMPVEGWGMVQNHEAEVREAANHPNIHLLQLKMENSLTPREEIHTVTDGWQPCGSEVIKTFSSTAYFFGRNLEKYRNVPIGLIQTCWGGTAIEAWTSEEALRTEGDFNSDLDLLKQAYGDKAKFQTEYNKKLDAWQVEVNKKDLGYTNGVATWAQPDFDDAAWKTMAIPGMIDQFEDMKYFDGLVWFRLAFDVPASWAGKDLKLDLGSVDDFDNTYFNGVLVGRTIQCCGARTYTVPGRLVKAGRNVLAVTIEDTGGLGGLGGDANGYKLSLGDKSIPLAGQWHYKMSTAKAELPSAPANMLTKSDNPSVIYNAMIYPLIGYALRGAIWYQGEANENRPAQYRKLMPLLIRDWREKWQQNFPFYLVQLANYMERRTEPVESNWAGIRDAQLRALKLENTGMAVAIDIGNANDIHPKNKQEVGRRLGLIARALTYGEDVEYSGPLYKDFKIVGNSIRLTFTHDKGLKTQDGKALTGFQMCGVDGKYHWADAKIEGNEVVVTCKDVTLPFAVRYAWADNPACNLTNASGLPASPFQTGE